MFYEHSDNINISSGLRLNLRCLVVRPLRVVVAETDEIASASISQYEVNLALGEVHIGAGVYAIFGGEQRHAGSICSVSVGSPLVPPGQTLWCLWNGTTWSPLLEESLDSAAVRAVTSQLIHQYLVVE